MRESWEQTRDNPTAVAHGLERSGRIVTSAALIVIVVAGSFAFADIVLIKALGRRHRHRGRARCDRRPGAPRARDDAPARTLELVAAGPARACRLPALEDEEAPGVEAAHWPRASAACAAALVVSGAAAAPILANPPLDFPTPVTPTAPPDRPADPIPVELPRDDGPHDRLTEWWYYTGHLDGGGRPAVRVRGGRLPRRARRRAGRVGFASRPHRRIRPAVHVRAAERDRAAGRSLAT